MEVNKLMEKLNKLQLIDLVAEEAHLSKKDAKNAVETTFDLIADALLNGKEVNITNFASLLPLTRQSRIGTDPKTHQKITLAEKKTVTIKLSNSFKNKLN